MADSRHAALNVRRQGELLGLSRSSFYYETLVKGRPKIVNTDQGAQFTADAFTACLLAANIQVGMDDRGRALDNVFCERLWRSVKYEDIYLNQYETVRQLHAGLTAYFDFYNQDRPHQSLNYRTPAEEHFVLCSEPAAFALMHLIFPISWSNDWGSPYARHALLGTACQVCRWVLLRGTRIARVPTTNPQLL